MKSAKCVTINVIASCVENDYAHMFACTNTV